MLMGSSGEVDASGKARGSRAETVSRDKRRGRDGETTIALNDATWEASVLTNAPMLLTFHFAKRDHELCFVQQREQLALVFDGSDGGRLGEESRGRRLAVNNFGAVAQHNQRAGRINTRRDAS